MKIVERLNGDKEIQKLRKRLYEITGQSLPFNYDCYLGLEDYREHLRQCVNAGKIITRPQDIRAAHRFGSKKNITNRS